MFSSCRWPIYLLPRDDREEALRSSTFHLAILLQGRFRVDFMTARMMALCVNMKPMILAGESLWTRTV